ncbi:MAG: hypothetical protein U0L23_07110 [Lachnospiraceae bacterium]|mgnify:CR=1 FL=1|nr:hypothetical protein [Lachnospiraceae bacterium]MEE1342471.1 hypothetical protein [Lachnospiraceae bacterium]
MEEWNTFIQTGRVEDYLQYVSASNLSSREKEKVVGGKDNGTTDYGNSDGFVRHFSR